MSTESIILQVLLGILAFLLTVASGVTLYYVKSNGDRADLRLQKMEEALTALTAKVLEDYPSKADCDRRHQEQAEREREYRARIRLLEQTAFNKGAKA